MVTSCAAPGHSRPSVHLPDARATICADMWRHQHRTAYERLLRRLLRLPQRPAVLLLNHYAYIHAGHKYYFAMGDRLAACCSTYVVRLNASPPPLFASEDHVNVLASYYGLPSLSFRDAVWPLIQANVSGYQVYASTQCLPPELNSIQRCEDQRNALIAAGGNLAAINKNSLLYYGKWREGGIADHRAHPCVLPCS